MIAIFKTPAANPSLPWYKNYMVTLFVIGLPLVMVMLCIYLVVYSVENADTTVRDDWYMDGKTLYADASKDKLAHDLGLSGNMTFTPTGNIQLNIETPSGSNFVRPQLLKMEISHATEKDKDRDLNLTLQPNGSYQGNANLATGEGKYYLVVHDEKNTWRLRDVAQLPTDKTLKFVPLHAFDTNADQVSNVKPSDVKIDERKSQN